MRYGAHLLVLSLLSVLACGGETTEPQPNPVASVVLTPGTTLLVSLGETAQITAVAQDAAGGNISGKTFTWTSSDNTIATVSSSGLVTAWANGMATVTGTTDGISGSASVTVEQALAVVEVTPNGASLSGVGSTQSLSAEPQDLNGNPMPTLSATWTSLNPNIATIDEAGLATAVASGQVTVAADVGGLAGYAVLTVSVPGASPVVSWNPMTSGTTNFLRGVWGTSPSGVYAVGLGGTILHYDGTDWSEMVSPVDVESLNDVWGTSSDDIYAVGHAGTILHYDGIDWSIMPTLIEDNMLGVWAASPTDVFAVTNQGLILHFDGTAWTSVFAPTIGTLLGVWGSSSTDVYATGTGGRIIHYDGDTWTTFLPVGEEDVQDAWGTSSSDIFAVARLFPTSKNGTILHYDGVRWRTQETGTIDEVLLAAWGTSTGDVFAVGDNGAILRGLR